VDVDPQPKAVMEPVAYLTGLGRVDQDGGRAGPAVAHAAEESAASRCTAIHSAQERLTAV
jgi:hypothetical protein